VIALLPEGDGVIACDHRHLNLGKEMKHEAETVYEQGSKPYIGV
jgi:hypothetical protein